MKLEILGVDVDDGFPTHTCSLAPRVNFLGRRHAFQVETTPDRRFSSPANSLPRVSSSTAQVLLMPADCRRSLTFGYHL